MPPDLALHYTTVAYVTRISGMQGTRKLYIWCFVGKEKCTV